MKTTMLAAGLIAALAIGPTLRERVEKLEDANRELGTQLERLEIKVARLSSDLAQRPVESQKPDRHAITALEKRIRTIEQAATERVGLDTRLSGGEIGNMLRDRVVRIMKHKVGLGVTFRYPDLWIEWLELSDGHGCWNVMGLVKKAPGERTVGLLFQFENINSKLRDRREVLATMNPSKVVLDEKQVWPKP